MTQLNPIKIITGELKNAAAVGAFNEILLEHAEAIVTGAERVKLPVILQISQNCVDYHGALRPIALASKAIAQDSSVSVSLHLDHAESESLVREALDLGFDSIMFDGSKLEYSSNVQASARMAQLCRDYGATIEVELGEVGGKDGVHSPGVRTNPTEAQAFVEATGVDLLAVAVGSSHAMTTRDATLDFELISHIAKTVSVPLVLHGSSGVNDEDLQRAVKAGMRKVNIATHLNHLFTDEIREILNSDSKIVDPRKYVKSARNKVADECGRLLQLLALS
jgi:fructose-bisphosphate aldolase class II